MREERVMIDIKVNHAQRSGYFVRCTQLREAIEKIETLRECTVVGLVYDGANTIELLLDPPIGDDDE
jgi:predicted amino acid racemase|tara:strand:+ start:437 stop:637 length:201 start_codon:yes stop_codon:yes gene_type:complete